MACKCLTNKSREVVTSHLYQWNILWKVIKVFVKKKWHRTGELIYSWGRIIKVYCWPCQLKADYIWWTLWTKMEEKAFTRWIAAYQISENLLIWPSNKTTTWYTKFNWNHHLFKLLIIQWYFQDLSVFCTGQIRELNGDVVGITTPTSFKSLLVALIFAIPLRMKYSF